MTRARTGIRAVLFDKDGTLVDFARTWDPLNRRLALHLALGDEGLAAELLHMGGYRDGRLAGGAPLAAGDAASIAALWAGQLPGWRPEALAREIDALFEAALPDHLAAVPDLEPVLAQLARLPLGLATSDSERAARLCLDLLGVAGHFGFVAGWDSGYGRKPEPGMVQAFCAHAGLPPGAVAVVGDSPGDLAMARAAGAGLAVGVLTGPARRVELEPLADAVLDGLGELPGLLERYAG